MLTTVRQQEPVVNPAASKMENPVVKRIMIIAGEASGDLHGAALVREALTLNPDLDFFGIGGPLMRSVGASTLIDAREMAVVGLVEVLAHFPVIYRAFRAMERILKESPPDLLVLIDYPDFNLRLAKVAKRCGVKVLYYISPQVWAWRVGRVKKIARLVDHMAVVFPFEVPFYEKEGVPVTFVGHPLVDSVAPTMAPVEAHQQFGTDPARKTIGLFPGSRKQEIRTHLPVMLAAAVQLRDRFPDLQFILPLASSLEASDIEPHLHRCPVPVTVVVGQSCDVIPVCDAIIAVSGTVTLEIALLGVPMVIIYQVSPLTYAIGKRLIRVDHIGICNIVAGERVVPELIQHAMTPERIVAETERYLVDAEHHRATVRALATVRENLGAGGCSRKVAGIALEMLGK
jgi:lipid-A-disaccharide synthase